MDWNWLNLLWQIPVAILWLIPAILIVGVAIFSVAMPVMVLTGIALRLYDAIRLKVRKATSIR